MTPEQFAYDAWCRNNGVEPLTPIERAMGNQKHLERFIRLMREHTVQGWFRYGDMQKYRDQPVDCIEKIMECIHNFALDGNIEHFVDIGNWAGIAFLYQRHPLRHYETHNTISRW